MLFLFHALLDDLGHLVHLGLHVADQLELGTAAVQIMILPMDAEVDVAVQMVGRKRVPHSRVIILAPMGSIWSSSSVRLPPHPVR